MGKFIDLTGQKFGRLTVISRAENDKTNHVRWFCECDCGITTIVKAQSLRSGATQSCGCYNKEVVRQNGTKLIKNLVNKKFGKLLVLSRSDERKGREILWNCRCECGKETRIAGSNLRSGGSTSCGCVQRNKLIERNTTHGLSKSRLYCIWSSMKSRCLNINEKSYKRYGGRGIKICDDWLNKDTGFMNFYNWAIKNGYADNLTIDRIDNNKGYSPDNCRWVSVRAQNNNRCSNHYIIFNGESHSISDWSRILGLNERAIRSRLNRGWNDIDALLGKKNE